MAVRVRGREIHIPITVTVGLDELVDIVVDHLNTGTENRELLVEYHALRPTDQKRKSRTKECR